MGWLLCLKCFGKARDGRGCLIMGLVILFFQLGCYFS